MKNCKNTGANVAMVTRFCGSSVTVMTPSILRLTLDFFLDVCAFLLQRYKNYFKYGLMG